METEEHYILFEGVRIGFYKNKPDAVEGLKINNKGMVISKTDYDKYYNIKNVGLKENDAKKMFN